MMYRNVLEFSTSLLQLYSMAYFMEHKDMLHFQGQCGNATIWSSAFGRSFFLLSSVISFFLKGYFLRI